MAPRTTHRRDATRTDRRRAALQRRRQEAAARTLAAHRARSRHRRRQILLGMGVVAIVAVGVLGFLELRRIEDRPPRPALRAALVPGASGALALGPEPAGYHAVYRAESYQGSKVTHSTEDVSIQRPFDGRVTIREGTSPTGTIQFDGKSTLGSYSNATSAGPGQVSDDAPTEAFGDLRLTSSLDQLVAKGLFVPRERRHALDRDCQVYRTGSPLQSLKITAPTAKDYADACIDTNGLLVEEVSVASGKLSQHLTATEITTNPTFDDGTFTMDGDKVGADQGASTLTSLDVNTAPGPGYWVLDAPAGFDHRGRYQLDAPDQSSQGGPPPSTSYVDVYVKGIDVLILHQGPNVAEPDTSSAASSGDPVTLAPLGSAQVMLSSIGPIVEGHPTPDTFIQLSSTLSPADTQAAVAGLHPA